VTVCLCTVVSLFKQWSVLMGTTRRVGELEAWLRQTTADNGAAPAAVKSLGQPPAAAGPINADAYQVEAREEEEDALPLGVLLSLRNVSVSTPSGVPLVHGVSLDVEEGMSLCITGPSGTGKSSLLRAISGLWPAAGGSIVVGTKAFFLPQRPYLFPGSLRQQVVYPASRAAALFDDGRIEELIRFVELGHLVDEFALDGEESWATFLSPGEQQRLGMVRRACFCQFSAKLMILNWRVVRLLAAGGAIAQRSQLRRVVG
jgi:ABC-type uncharacterized transport system fused permease/ATPase subunit